MVLAEAGDQDWPKGFYACGLNGSETKDGRNDNRLATLHQAAANAPSYHYSPGVVFTAPKTGLVEFVYQYAGLDAALEKFDFHIMRESATGYGDALHSYKATKAVSSSSDTGSYDEVTLKLNVTQGEKVYFIVDSPDGGGMTAHWIKSAKYLESSPTYTLATDKTSYAEGEAITVTSSVSEGGFSARDTVKITPAGGTPALSLTAAATVRFLPTTGQLPAGSYQVALVYGGLAVATAEITVTSSTPPEPATSWDNGDLMEHYKNNRSFYDAGTPFGYAFYYEGTNAGEDDRSKGFYDMQLSTHSDGWISGFYTCGKAPGDAPSTWVNTIHQAAANAPSYHYSPGMVFTAPAAGMVEFTYQFAKAYGGGGCDNHVVRVLRDVADPYEKGAIATFTPSAVLTGEGDGASGTPETQTITVNVTQGEKIYFVIDNHEGNGGMSAHWIKAARYVEETPAYTLATDRTDYIEGEAIQVTATVSKGGFSATDTVKIIPANSTQAAMTLPAAGTVTFSPSAQELPAGSYQITLVHDGIAKATAEITVASSTPPQPGTSWDNGDIMEHYKDNRSFYAAESPFGYAFYYEGTNPDDSRSKGFYEMLLSTNSDGWLNGFYGCGTTADEAGTVWGGTIHQAAANAPSYHYSPGMVFTAPKTGTVEFTYQFAKAYGGGGCDNHVIRVLRDVEDPYEKGSIVTFTTTAVLSGEGEGATGTPETQVFTVPVNEGEKLYFVIDNHDANGGMSAHWIKAARYLEDSPRYTLTTDKNEYSAGETISVTATVANTRFDCTDRVKIRSGANNAVIMVTALAANGTAVLTPTAQQLPAGDYRVTLDHGGREVATRSISVAAPDITATEWTNGDLTDKVVTSEQKKSFYAADTPFGYAFFYEGTDPEDTRLSGFYDMVLATAGMPDWPNGFYACGLTGSEVKDGKNDNRLSTLQQAASCAPTYHYSPGIVFTAPHSGTVKFVYQYAGLDGVEDKFTIYVMRDSASTYAQAITSYKPTKAVSSTGQRMRTAAEDSPYDVAELEVSVTKGEKIYFVVDQNITEGGGMVTHWLQSATYTQVQPAYSLSLKENYNEGETITVTTKVTDGQIATGDTLKLIFKDDGAVVMEQAAAGTVNFTPTAEKTLVAGDYRAVLFHDGKEVASKSFRVVNNEVPTTKVWDFGDLVAHYKNPRTFYNVYDQHSPVGYAFFYEGTDDNDKRRKGFYDMVLAENNDDWSKGNYFCAPNKTDEKDGKNDPQIATIHQAASCAPTFHYSPGFVFTAPSAGMVEFTYQFAKAFGGGGCDSHVLRVMREGTRSYQNSVIDYTHTSTLSDDMNNPGTPTTKTLYVDMEAGEKLYFIVDNDGGNGGMTAHWIKSIRYVDRETAERNQEVVEKPVPKPETPYIKYESPTGEDWNNGDLPSFAKDKWKFYDQFSPFDYAFFYEGTDPQDPRLGGFHKMILAKAGETDWPKGFYACGLDDREVKDEVIDNRLNALHQAGATAPTYHYSPGIVFTAPYTGTVMFIYQYAGLDKLDDKFTFYVMREDAKTYADALFAEKPTKIINSADGSGDYDEMQFAVKMKRGEKLYFVNDSTDNGDMCIHCIKAAGYLSISPTFALETNKTRYVEGEKIKITTRVWDGEIGEGDMVRISPAGRVKVSMELPAARTLTFDPTEKQLPAGNYQVALIHNGETVASQEITVVGETVPDGSFWDNGDMPPNCKFKKNFYEKDTPFGYAFYYEGTDPEDPRTAGFYDMILSTAGDIDWPNGFYACGLTADEVKDGKIDNRLNTLHQAAANAPTYHYSPGIVFTAPYTGVVDIVYQYAGLDGVEDKFTFYVMRDSAKSYEDALYSYKPTKSVNSAGGFGKYDEVNLKLEVRKGEKIYFVTDSTGNGHMCTHWIKSAGYVTIAPTYILTSDKDSYGEGEAIAVTASVSEGEFSAGDMIQIIPEGAKRAAMELPVSVAATFTPSENQLPTGSNRIVLIHEGKEVASKRILIVGETVSTGTSWENGGLPEHCTEAGKRNFYAPETPFSYAFFYEGTDPEDFRLAGFYDMILSTAGDIDWPNGFYACGLTADEVKDGKIDNRLNTLHQAAANGPTYHYSPGMAFTAPFTGTVKFVYQYAGLDSVEEKFTFYVMRDSARSYDEALYSYKPTKAISSVDGSGGYDEAIFELDVTKGERIYFVTDNTENGHMCAHWIASAAYTSIVSSYTLDTDKVRYAEGETITATATVSDGEFGAGDVIRVISTAGEQVTMELPADEVVNFVPESGQIPAGNYRVALVHGGEEVAAKAVRIIAADAPFDGFWYNGDMLEHGKYKHDFYGADTPFSYAFFYEGTDPEDPRAKGFHDMILSTAGELDWPNGFYACGLTPDEVKDGMNDNRLNTLHQAMANSPTYHYSPGVAFTAPYTGTVEFVYQYAGLDGVEDKFTFYVMQQNAEFYEEALAAYKPTKILNSASGTGDYDEAVLRVGVTAGEKIYFVTDSTSNGHMCAHWIKSAEYVSSTPIENEIHKVTPEPGQVSTTASVRKAPNTVFDGTAWESGDLMAHYRDTHSFYISGTPFSYAFYYEGTDPGDSRAKGFYPMQLSNNNDGWSSGYYNCALKPGETGQARVSTIHQAASNAPSFHYSPGYCFTAPSTGVVEFTYQFAKAYGGGGCEGHRILVLRDVEDPYENGVIATFLPTAVISGEGAEASGTPETQVFTAAVTEGEKIYFVIDNHDANGGMSAHWIKTAKYISDEIPEESEQPVETAPPMTSAPDNTHTNSNPVDPASEIDPADPKRPFPSAVIWGGIGLIAALIAAAVVLVKKKKTADGGKEESKTGLPR